MENKQAVAVAVGVGAVGTALAYLGYSVYNNNADIENLAEAQNNSWWAELWSNSNTDEETVLSPVGDADGPQLKEALKEETNNVEKKESAWPTFWKGEYDKANEEEAAAADAADAADASGLN